MPKLKEYKMFIDGKWVNSIGKKKFKTLNPEKKKTASAQETYKGILEINSTSKI